MYYTCSCYFFSRVTGGAEVGVAAMQTLAKKCSVIAYIVLRTDSNLKLLLTGWDVFFFFVFFLFAVTDLYRNEILVACQIILQVRLPLCNPIRPYTSDSQLILLVLRYLDRSHYVTYFRAMPPT